MNLAKDSSEFIKYLSNLIETTLFGKSTVLLMYLVGALLLVCSPGYSKQISLPNTDTKLMTSKENGIKYKLFISLPEGYRSSDESYPVLYLLDPDDEFPIAENIARNLVNYSTIRPFIIVGIGYQDQDLSKMEPKLFWKNFSANRARDFIPMQVKAGIEDFEGGDGENKGLARSTGGSEKFKSFMEKELIPSIDRSYRTSKERALLGHSQAGLFATWMMLTYPSIFRKYLILSPSLWVEKGQMIKQSHKLNTTIEIKAYFSVGSLEYDSKRSMVDDVKVFYSGFPKSKSFESKFEIVDDENHVSMVPAALTKGFKFLFGAH